MFEQFSKALEQISAQPTTIFALLGLLGLVVAFIYISRIKLTLKMTIHIGLMLALTVILHNIRLYHMPQGGSVTLGGMVPILLIALCYGPSVGFLTGFLYGMLNLFQDPYILHPVQVLFDYPLPYMCLGLIGYFRKHIITGTIVAIGGRFICHFISGVVFFADYAPKGMSPYWYSMVFNATYLIPELVITLIILKVLPVKRLLHQMNPDMN